MILIGGGGHYLKINMLTLKKKLTLNNLSSKYFAIVGDTSAIFFKKKYRFAYIPIQISIGLTIGNAILSLMHK